MSLRARDSIAVGQDTHHEGGHEKIRKKSVKNGLEGSPFTIIFVDDITAEKERCKENCAHSHGGGIEGKLHLFEDGHIGGNHRNARIEVKTYEPRHAKAKKQESPAEEKF
jgi:hypothetical protein